MAICLVIISLTAGAHAGSIFDDNPPPATPATPPKKDTAVRPAQGNPVGTEARPSDPSRVPVPLARDSRAAVPSKSELLRSRHELEEVYAQQLRDTSAGGRRKLAQELIKEGLRPQNSLADRFELLSGAMAASREASSITLAFRAVDSLSETFQIDGLLAKKQAVFGTRVQGPSKLETTANVDAVLELVDALLESDDVDSAARVVETLRGAAVDAELRQSILIEWQTVEAHRTALSAIRPDLDRLNAVPSDPAANLAVGIGYCIRLGRWSRGLPFLSKGSDTVLRDLALQELRSPAAPFDALKVADGWWDYSMRAGTSDADAGSLKIHSGQWYRVGKSAAAGLAEKLVEVRLREVDSLTSKMRHTRTVNLLAFVDPAVGTRKGTWTLKGEVLQGESGSDGATIEFPYHPPAEYDVRVRFALTQKNYELNMSVKAEMGPVIWQMVCEDWQGGVTRFGFIKGAQRIPNTPSDPAALQIQHSKECEALVKVRINRLEGFLNGKLMGSWDDPKTSAVGGWRTKDRNSIALAIWQGNVRITAVEVTELSGCGRVVDDSDVDDMR
jgi:hypothetical protein